MPKANEVTSTPGAPTPPVAPAMPGLPPLSGTPAATVESAAPTTPAPPPTSLTVAELQARLAAAQAVQAQAVAPTAPPMAIQPPPATVTAPPITMTMISAPDAAIQVVEAAPVLVPPVAPIVVPTVAPSPTVSPVVSSQFDLGSQMSAMASPTSGGSADAFKSFDLSGVQTSNFKLLPLEVPFYEGRITKCELKKSSTGFPQIKLTVKTCYPTQHAGVSLQDYITLQPATMWKYKSLLEATGYISPDGARSTWNEASDFIGRVVQFRIKHEPYEGELRNKIAGGYAEATYTEESEQQIGLVGTGPQVNWG